jgi:hypothetical protein
MTRKYEKKSNYWNKFAIPNQTVDPNTSKATEKLPKLEIESFASNEEESGEAWISKAQRIAGTRTNETLSGTRTQYRNTIAYNLARIDGLPLPYNYDEAGGVNIKDAVELVIKCYANVGIAKNSVDIMADTANTNYYLEGGTAKSRKFTELWFKKIDIDSIKEQFFTECFRSGNVFFYKLTGNWNARSFAAKYSDNLEDATPLQLPLKYILLNPAEIVRDSAIISDYQFSQRFSPYEIKRMNNPQTDKEKAIFDSIKDKSVNLENTGIVLEDKHICFAFYNKLDYEPFALPFLWPVLSDINLKLEMKKRDQQVLRLINNCILLLTNGTEPDKGGVNKENIAVLNRIFQQEACGRTLVSDYTTKGQFLIPELKNVLYPEKYTIVNEDIKEALSNILFGTDAKYGNLVVKVQVFLRKMAKARRTFEKMMQREIELACEYMGITEPPTIKTDKESLEDPAILQKTALRLLELGVLTPEEAIPLLKNREYPNLENILSNQKEYLEQREDGLFMPLVGGQPLYDNGIGQAAPKTGAAPSGGRPKEKGMASLTTLEDWKSALSFKEECKNKVCKAFDTVKDTKEGKEIINELSAKLFRSYNPEEWDKVISEVVSNPDIVDDMTAKVEIIEASLREGISLDDAALLKFAETNYKQKTSQQTTNSVLTSE